MNEVPRPVCDCTPEGDIARERRPDLHQEHCTILKWWTKWQQTYSMEFAAEHSLPRDQRQEMIANWARAAFGEAAATGLPQRGLRLLEEAIEAFQACGGDEAMAHKLVSFVFARPPGMVGQELGGVAVTVLALAAAAGLSADEEECREIHRVLSKPLGEFTQRNAAKNAAGFKIP